MRQAAAYLVPDDLGRRWTYTLNENHDLSLRWTGQRAADRHVTVFTEDGTPETVVTTITGINDNPGPA